MKKMQLIDILRSFSILAVLATHSQLSNIMNATQDNHWVRVLFFILSHNGKYGVSIFFVISGFLITGLISNSPGGLSHPNFKYFYVRRIGRIIPLLTLVCLMGILILVLAPAGTSAIIYCYKNANVQLTAPFWLSVITFTFDSFLRFSGSIGAHWNVLWSLSIEEQFYLFYPLLLKITRGGGRLRAYLTLLILIGPVARLVNCLTDSRGIAASSFSFCYFDQIAWGAMLFLCRNQYKNFLEKNMNYCLILCGLGSILLAWVYFDTTAGNSFERIYTLTLLGFGTFLFLLGGLSLDFFESGYLKLFALPGKISYGMYLLHSTVLFMFWSFLSGKSATFAFPIYVLATTFISWISFRYYEIPINARIQNKFLK